MRHLHSSPPYEFKIHFVSSHSALMHECLLLCMKVVQIIIIMLFVMMMMMMIIPCYFYINTFALLSNILIL